MILKLSNKVDHLINYYFIQGWEWEEEIKIKIVDSIEELTFDFSKTHVPFNKKHDELLPPLKDIILQKIRDKFSR